MRAPRGRLIRLWSGVVVAAMLAACGQAATPPGSAVPEEPMPSETPSVAPVQDARPPAPNVRQAINAFGLDLLTELDDGGNVVVSPLSVAVALSMLANGASGEARAELEHALHVDGDEDARNTQMAALLHDLVTGRDVDTRIAQSLWVQDGFRLDPGYVERVTTTFDARVEETDFASPESVDHIDGWVSDKTEGLIDSIARDLGLPAGDMVLVLLNATYFHGQWTVQFDPDDTEPRTFQRGTAGGVHTPFLVMLEPRFGYHENDVRQVLRLPYGDKGRFVFDIYLPREGRAVAAVVPEIPTAPPVRERELGEVAIPKLELEQKYDLKDGLLALGVQRVWTEGALTRLSGDSRTYLSDAIHKTFLQVDEQGTKAAAVTGIAVRVTSAPANPPPSFVADRPFAFAMRDTHTGVTLFTGIVRDPTA